MEPEGSLPHSQVSATCPYSEPDSSSPCSHNPIPGDPSQYYPPIYAWVFQVVSFLSFPHQNPMYTYPLPIRSTYPTHLILLVYSPEFTDTELIENMVQALPHS